MIDVLIDFAKGGPQKRARAEQARRDAAEAAASAQATAEEKAALLARFEHAEGKFNQELQTYNLMGMAAVGALGLGAVLLLMRRRS